MQVIENTLNRLNLVRFTEIEHHPEIPTYQTLIRWGKSGKFPKPTKLGHSFVAWKKSEIEHWLADHQQSGV